MTEEEVAMEMEAVEAVYGDEAVIVDSYPPHLHLHIKPRTAEISSQQFVEAVVRIQAGPKYPDEPPEISLIESKGLDEERQKLLMGFVQEKSLELSSSLMLVALCEEAVERLTIMNHPDGDCPLCLYPLFPEDGESDQMPFMKLMSCFHCFHCECIIRWWNWLHTEKEADSVNGNSGSVDKSLGNCPVCRKVQDPVLQSESENMRRERFEAILKTQEEQGGLVQPKKNISVVPGMYLPPPPAPASSSSNQEEAQEQGQQVEQYKDAESETNSSSSNNRRGRGRGRGGRGHSNVNRRKQNPQDPRKPTKQWVQRS
ncbi:hypothetical protein IGI04_014213 [Brassica rapa subsp. trilocularis]|uniref:E3 ubiquitin-protein ligase RNF25 n=1 Tax=Brassica rapa subsp. trilocularis TaxID=1813537 RepID=A0ABQ7MPU7_BRACM|nr:hypothetical protein IGI04_014213 [Brassica rapa subsp. trilocularis]